MLEMRYKTPNVEDAVEMGDVKIPFIQHRSRGTDGQRMFTFEGGSCVIKKKKYEIGVKKLLSSCYMEKMSFEALIPPKFSMVQGLRSSFPPCHYTSLC